MSERMERDPVERLSRILDSNPGLTGGSLVSRLRALIERDPYIPCGRGKVEQLSKASDEHAGSFLRSWIGRGGK